MREPVLDVGPQHRAHPVDDLAGPRRTEDPQRLRRRAHHPLGRDDVVEVADVIAVQMREENRVEHDRQHAGGHEPHAHAATGVEEQRAPARPHERGRAGAVRIRQRVAGAEQHHFDRHVKPPGVGRRTSRAHASAL